MDRDSSPTEREINPCKRKRTNSMPSIEDVEQLLPTSQQEIRVHDSCTSDSPVQTYPDIHNPGFEVFEETGEIIHHCSEENGETELSPPAVFGGNTEHFESSNFSEREAVAENLLASSSERSRIYNSAGKLEKACHSVSIIPSTSSNLSIDSVSGHDNDINNSSRHSLPSLQLTQNQNRPVQNFVCPEFTACEGKTKVDNINDFPYHIIVNIFRNLSMRQLLNNISLVCKLWHQLARDPDLWRVIDLQHQHKLDDWSLFLVSSFSDRVMYLNVSDTRLLTNQGIKQVLLKCLYLQTLKLTRCLSLANDSLSVVGENCRHLQDLFIEGCYQITDISLSVIGKGCPKLQQIHLSRCHNIADAGLIAIAEGCHNLRQISLDYCNKISDSAIKSLSENCRTMEYMSLMSCDITDEGLQSLRVLKNLRVLDISNIARITPSCLPLISISCPELECLNISLNTQLGDDCIIDVVRYGYKLRRLCLSLANDSLSVVGENCRHLQDLFIEGCYQITDISLSVIGKGCPKLQQIHLSRCHNIADAGLIAIAEGCHNLRQISLDYCNKISDSAIKSLSENCRTMEYMSLMSCDITDEGLQSLRVLKNLRVLDISNIARITPSCLPLISISCPELECLNISLNTQLGDDCIIDVVRYGYKLRRLYCVSCSLTDRALTKIGEYTKTIETLDIGWCKDVTDEGVRTISATCPTLSYLGLIRCDNVTVEAIEQLVQTYPRINYSTFILESRKLIERARREGFKFEPSDNGNSKGGASGPSCTV